MVTEKGCVGMSVVEMLGDSDALVKTSGVRIMDTDTDTELVPANRPALAVSEAIAFGAQLFEGDSSISEIEAVCKMLCDSDEDDDDEEDDVSGVPTEMLDRQVLSKADEVGVAEVVAVLVGVNDGEGRVEGEKDGEADVVRRQRGCWCVVPDLDADGVAVVRRVPVLVGAVVMTLVVV